MPTVYPTTEELARPEGPQLVELQAQEACYIRLSCLFQNVSRLFHSRAEVASTFRKVRRERESDGESFRIKARLR